MVCVPVVSMVWLVIVAFQLLTASFSSDIRANVCIPWGSYSSVAAEKAVAFTIFFVVYLLPLALMIFWYARIVYKLRTQVSVYHHVRSELNLRTLSAIDELAV